MTIACQWFYDALTARGIGFYAGVPDSLLKSFCAYVADHSEPGRHVITANEGSAIALVAGHFLATGMPGLVYLQNSGLGNAVNPLTSLADPAVYGVPLLLLIGWRGEPGKKDEPQHVHMGRCTQACLDAIGVPHAELPGDAGAAADVLDRALRSMQARSAPFALVATDGTFSAYARANRRPDLYPLTREGALEALLAAIPERAAVVCTTGMPSRELFAIRARHGTAHDSDFLTVGSMGHCSQIALGVALARPDRPTYCIDGDGAVLMHMGGLATTGSIAPPSFKHVVLNNGAHDSVGGQETVAFDVDLCAIATACGYAYARRAITIEELRSSAEELCRRPGPGFLEVRVKQGARPDLGRPTLAPKQTRDAFMEFLRR